MTKLSHRTLPEVKSEELVERADDILRSAIEEEKIENAEMFDESAEQNVLDNLPERNHAGGFEVRENFARRELENDNLQNDDEQNQFRARRSDFGGTHNTQERGFERRGESYDHLRSK